MNEEVAEYRERFRCAVSDLRRRLNKPSDPVSPDGDDQLSSEKGDELRPDVIMAAREIERVFGGLSVRLWDDPIEWTLPETLRTGHEISTYLDDVEKAFEAGMNGITADTDLEKEIWTPAGVRKIRDILDSALSRIDTFLGAANGESDRDTQVREQ